MADEGSDACAVPRPITAVRNFAEGTDVSGYGCPQCGGEKTYGYGFTGGGIGHYQMCHTCGWFHKEHECRWCETPVDTDASLCGSSECNELNAENAGKPENQ